MIRIEKKELTLKSLKWKEGQKVVHNIPGKRGIRMDFVAESEDGRVFDVEMQNRKEIVLLYV